jgi:radical SAM protein with 4Fe4S-binding SPASM domain
MTPAQIESAAALLAELLGQPGADAPVQAARTFMHAAGAALERRLDTEARALRLVAAALDAGVTELVVYGAAEIGRTIARQALAAGLRVPCFVESQVAFEGRRVDGIEVVRLAQARAGGFHCFALGTLHRERELTAAIAAAYGTEGGWRAFTLPPAGTASSVAAPAAQALLRAAQEREGLAPAVRRVDPALFTALLTRLAEAPEPPAPVPPAAPARAAADWPEEPLDPRLLRAASPLAVANLQFTGDCNLKCTYCGHAQSGWSGSRMTPDMLEQIIGFILRDRVRKVMIGFFGEATLFQGWEAICARLLDAGVALATNSNFLRPLRPEEVDVFSRFSEIAMSIDTVDLELQKRLRPPMDVRNLVHAYHRIRARALLAGRPAPHFIWTGVLTPEVVPHLPEFFAYAKSCGVTHLNLNEVCPIEESASMANLYDLDDDAFEAMTAELGAAVALAERLELVLTLPLGGIAGRLERIRRRQAGDACAELPKVRVRSFQGTAVFPFQRIPEGKVGLCHAPWTSVHVMPTGEVFPCCFQGAAMGTLGPGQGLREILDNDRYRAFRAALLTGRELNETCRNCMLVQRVVDPAEARAAVAELLGLEPGTAGGG